MNNHNLKYIVVEGPIGVGKTSLAQRLSDEFGSTLLLEHVDDNPFLERFYQNPAMLVKNGKTLAPFLVYSKALR